MAIAQKVVILTWKQKRPWVIHLPQSSGLLGAISRSQDPNKVLTADEAAKALQEFKPFLIAPNTNEYPLAMWELVKSHPDVRAQISDGQLVVETKEALGQIPKEGEAKEDPAQAMPGTLDKVAGDKARDLAENCDDLELLKKWLASESAGQKRSSVLDALKGKIDLVKDMDARFGGEAAGK